MTTAAYFRHLVALLMAMGMSGCDFDVDPDPVVEDNVGVPETRAERRANEGLVLRGGEKPFAKGTRTRDTHSVEMQHLGVTITEADDVHTGSANMVYSLNRELDVMSPAIWKITNGEVGTTISTKLRSQETAEEVEEPHPLSGEIVIRDGARHSIERAGASAEQKAALKTFQSDWFGGDALFADKPVRRREGWAIRPEVVLEAFLGRKFTDGSGSAHLFVQQTLNFDDERTAEVSMSVERCRGTTTDAEGNPMEVEFHGFGTLHRSLEPLHTTQVDLEGTVKITINKGDDSLVKFNGPFRCRSRSEITRP